MGSGNAQHAFDRRDFGEKNPASRLPQTARSPRNEAIGGALTGYPGAFRRLGRDARLFLVAAVVHAIAVMGIFGVLFNLYLLRLGYGPEFIGIANAAGMIAFGAFSLPAGMIAQAWGMRRSTLASLGLGVLAFGLLPLASSLPEAFRPGWLVALNAASSLSVGMFHVSMMPYLMATTGPLERNQAFSLRWAFYYVGSFGGSLLGGLLPPAFATVTGESLSSPAPFRDSLLASSLLLLGAFWVVWRAHEVRIPPPPATESRRRGLPIAMFGMFAAAVFLWSTAEGAVWVYFNVYLDSALHVSTASIGTLVAVGRIAGLPAALFAPAIVRWLGDGQTAALGTLAGAVALIPIALIHHWAAAGAGFVALNAAVATVAPALYLFMFGLVPGDRRLAITGLSLAAGVGGFTLVALGGGYMIGALGYRSFFLTAAAITAVGVALFWALFIQRRKPTEVHLAPEDL